MRDMLTDEWYLGAKLKARGLRFDIYASIFANVKTEIERREGMRAAILASGYKDDHCWNQRGKPLTFSEVFSSIYGEPLEKA